MTAAQRPQAAEPLSDPRARAVPARPEAVPRPPLRVVRPPERGPRSRRRRVRLLTSGATALVVALLFGLVAFHVLIAQSQLRLGRLETQAGDAQARNDRLRLQVAELSSPARIVASAQERLGMVPPPGVTYLSPVSPGMVPARAPAATPASTTPTAPAYSTTPTTAPRSTTPTTAPRSTTPTTTRRASPTSTSTTAAPHASRRP